MTPCPCYPTLSLLSYSSLLTVSLINVIQGNDAVSGKICIVPYSILEKLVDNGRIRPEQVCKLPHPYLS